MWVLEDSLECDRPPKVQAVRQEQLSLALRPAPPEGGTRTRHDGWVVIVQLEHQDGSTIEDSDLTFEALRSPRG